MRRHTRANMSDYATGDYEGLREAFSVINRSSTTSLRAPEVKKFVPSGCYEVT